MPRPFRDVGIARRREDDRELGRFSAETDQGLGRGLTRRGRRR